MTVTNKRLGRPTINPKTIQTRIRMTKEEAERLQECSKVLGISKTQVLMNGLDEVYSKLPKK